jgi:hypothetical protein
LVQREWGLDGAILMRINKFFDGAAAVGSAMGQFGSTSGEREILHPAIYEEIFLALNSK